MPKIAEKMVFLFMIIQAFATGSIYMQCKKEKWNLRENMTVFVYPFFSFVLISFVIFSLLLSAIYFIHKLKSWKKIYYCIPIIITIIFVVVSNEKFSEMKLREYNFEDYLGKREEIVELILAGKLIPDETGTICLPEKLQNEEMARGGCVYIVKYKEFNGIYFCTFSGVMDSTAGYVYLTNYSCESSLNNILILQESYEGNWYFGGTN